MRAIIIREHGGPEKLTLADIAEPLIGSDEVLVRVKACGANRQDWWARSGVPGLVLSFPHILGIDIAGEVARTGSEVTHIAEGDKVILYPGLSCGKCDYCLSGDDDLCNSFKIQGYHVNGGYAEFIKAPARNAIRMPERLTFEEAACIPYNFLVAWNMLVTKAHVKAGETVMVWTPGSAPGTALMQIAKLHGATVIAVARKKENLSKADNYGADYLIHSEKQDVVAEVMTLTENRGVDIVFDHFSNPRSEIDVKVLAHRGRLVGCGVLSGWSWNIDLNPLYLKQASIVGNNLGTRKELLTLLKFSESGRLKSVVSRVMPLEAASHAHTLLEDNELFGRIILKP